MATEVLEKAGTKVVLLGNEAIARGAVEAGIGLTTAYPGTPSSEVPMTLARMAKKVGFYFEYSSNEKVAFETAVGAAWSGVRALVAMKHFGLNVALDSVIPVAYTGVRAGLVVMVADDPQGWSSVQSEQDTRYHARMARMPMLEPSDCQECLDYTKIAFDISEKFEIPVFLRTTTRVSHSIGTVELGEIPKPKTEGRFEKDPDRYNSFRPHLQVLHDRLNRKIERIEKEYGYKLNKTFQGEGKAGIIASGVSFEYCKEALQDLGINPPVAKIGLSHPISKDFVGDFIKDKEVVLVVEELEPIIEKFTAEVAKDANPRLIVHGKDMLPRVGEYSLETVISAIEKLFGKKLGIDLDRHKKEVEKALEGLPSRKPVFCPGCGERSTFYAVKKVFGDDAIYAGDIGCYMMGIFEPFEMQNFIISMGAGIGISHGISKVTDQEVVAFVGDSTFFHAGMPGLLNYKFNNGGKAPLIVVIDNGITAMTGHQPHAGTGVTGMGEKVEPVKIEDVAKAYGAEVRIANAYSQKRLIGALKELKEVRGPKVLISRGECRLLLMRKMRRKGIPAPKFKITEEKFTKQCEKIAREFSCPAIIKVEKEGETTYRIDPDSCWGCGVCKQIFPKGVVEVMKEGRK